MTSALTPRDRYIPWYFVAFFVVIALVNAVMITLALRTQTGMVTDHPYEKGLAYNNVVAAEEAQKALGWRSELTLVQGTLHFALYDAAGNKLQPQRLMAHFSRPTNASMDFDKPLSETKTHMTFPANGVWDVRVFAIVGTERYQHSQRIIVP